MPQLTLSKSDGCLSMYEYCTCSACVSHPGVYISLLCRYEPITAFGMSDRAQRVTSLLFVLTIAYGTRFIYMSDIGIKAYSKVFCRSCTRSAGITEPWSTIMILFADEAIGILDKVCRGRDRQKYPKWRITLQSTQKWTLTGSHTYEWALKSQKIRILFEYPFHFR